MSAGVPRLVQGAPVRVPVLPAGRQRRPSGAPPPLPRHVERSGLIWLAAAVVATGVAIAVFASGLSRWAVDVTVIDDAMTRRVAGAPVPGFTAAASVIAQAGAALATVIAGFVLLLALIVLRRFRRLLVLVVSHEVLAVLARPATAGLRMKPRAALTAACTGLVVTLSACTSSSGHVSSAAGPAGRPGTVITVGSYDFPESVLLAQIYGQALAANNFPVRILPNLGPRELVDPALMDGLVQLVPEYAGSALEFFSLGRLSATSDAGAANRALAGSVAGRGVVAARPAPAQDANAIVVTAATAARYGLRSIADLARVAPRLVFGGPPECPERAYCLPGLQRAYGLRFKAFIPLDAGGPLTLQALEAGNVGVALLFTTDPAIPARHLVILADDRGLQPAENITPLVRQDVIVRYGPHLVALLNRISALLDTGTLRALDAQVELDGHGPRSVARAWLRAHQLIPEGGAVH